MPEILCAIKFQHTLNQPEIQAKTAFIEKNTHYR